MKIYGYARVSTDRQADRGLSLAAQQDRIRAYGRAMIGRQRVTMLIDKGVSASRVPFSRRPAGAQLEAAITSGDHLVIAKLDRGFRSVKDCAVMLEDWHRRGIVVHLLDIGAATNTPSGRLVVAIMAAIAEWESRRIGERIRDAHAALRARGMHPSNTPPLGFRLVRRRLRPDRRLQRLIGLIVRLRDSRRRPPPPFHAIAAWLTRYTRRPWTAKRCWRAYHSSHARQWARRVRIPPTWTHPVGYRHATGAQKRQAGLKVPETRRRYRALLGALASQTQ